MPSPTAAKISLALKKLQIEDLRMAMRGNNKASKDYYVKEIN
jgi:hypothetical protein